VTLEPEYYHECDDARFLRVKPLLWLWYSFDRTVVGGQNVWLGVQLRRMLATHIFRKCGANFKCFQHTEFSFGYNMDVGDDVVVHRHVLLDDRGGISLGDRVSIADYANIYSHTHSIVEQKDVTNAQTIIEKDVRITYHATVLAGVHVAENSMVGAMAMATKDVRPYHVYVGIPAKSVRVKPNAPESQENVTSTARSRGKSG
jgi:acetyltransferase-like isoleucine patch superfamily enzyme